MEIVLDRCNCAVVAPAVEMATATVVVPPEMIGTPPLGIWLVQDTPGELSGDPGAPFTMGTTVPQAMDVNVSDCGAENVLNETFSCPLAPRARLSGFATPIT
jgi:hypothetical protein